MSNLKKEFNKEDEKKAQELSEKIDSIVDICKYYYKCLKQVPNVEVWNNELPYDEYEKIDKLVDEMSSVLPAPLLSSVMIDNLRKIVEEFQATGTALVLTKKMLTHVNDLSGVDYSFAQSVVEYWPVEFLREVVKKGMPVTGYDKNLVGDATGRNTSIIRHDRVGYNHDSDTMIFTLHDLGASITGAGSSNLLYKAAGKGNLKAVRALIKLGADPNCPADHGSLPLSFVGGLAFGTAAREDIAQIAAELIMAGARLDQEFTYSFDETRKIHTPLDEMTISFKKEVLSVLEKIDTSGKATEAKKILQQSIDSESPTNKKIPPPLKM